MLTLSPERDRSGTRVFLGNVTRYMKLCLVVTPLQVLIARKSCRKKMEYLRSLPAGTVGHDLVQMLDSKGLKLIPGFTKHDLNHLILGYDMTPEEELCMQAYLIGNGHWQLQCFIFLSSAVLLPGLWSTLWCHYTLGKQSKSLSPLHLDDCLLKSTDQVRQQYAPSHNSISAQTVGPAAEFVG